MATTFDSSDYLSLRALDLRTRADLKWIAIYEMGDSEAHLIAHAGIFPPGMPAPSFQVAAGGPVLGAEMLEPVRFENNLLGFISAEKNSEKSTGTPKTVEEELQSLAAQVACFYRSSNRARVASIDTIVDRIHCGHPEKYHWTGVYMIDELGRLALETFRGEPTPHVIIPVDSGICGAAVREGKTLNISDVKSDARYLSCSILTKSEIVVPIRKNGKIIGEIDIDSHIKNAFSRHDEMDLTDYAEKISDLC